MGDALNRLAVGAHVLVSYGKGDVMHERVILWPAGGSSYAIHTLESDIYVVQLSVGIRCRR